MRWRMTYSREGIVTYHAPLSVQVRSIVPSATEMQIDNAAMASTTSLRNERNKKAYFSTRPGAITLESAAKKMNFR